MEKKIVLMLAGAVAGAVNGLLGAGGGMLLVPILTGLGAVESDRVFPASVAIITPICVVSLCLSTGLRNIPWGLTAQYLLGSAAGGILAGWMGKQIPTVWLHRALGILVLWGGVRYLC